MLISYAHASQEGYSIPLPAQEAIANLLPYLCIAIVFYFLLIKPQAKQKQEQQKIISSLKKGDKIMLHSGIFGDVVKVEDETLYLEIAPEVKIKVDKNAVLQLVE